MPAPRVFFLCSVALALLVGGSVDAQVSAEDQRKRDIFLRARESIQPVPAATPRATPVRPQPRPRPTPVVVEKPLEEIKLPTPQPATPRPQPPRRETEPDRPPATPRPSGASGGEREISLPPARDVPTPKPLPPPKDGEITLPPPRTLGSPATTPAPAPGPAAPIVIEKSGQAEDEGLAPVPVKERRGWFGLGGGPRYRYLTRGVRSAIDRAPVKRGRWQYIIAHNSATRQGNARIFNNYHTNVRRMKNGLAYHFVIGNGTSSGDGEIEIGSRWTRQINGGHVASDYLNNISIGVCFVGDFDRDQPTAAQLAAFDELVRYLRGRVGRSKGRVVAVRAHREINPKPTTCPGNRFPYRWMHRRFN